MSFGSLLALLNTVLPLLKKYWKAAAISATALVVVLAAYHYIHGYDELQQQQRDAVVTAQAIAKVNARLQREVDSLKVQSDSVEKAFQQDTAAFRKAVSKASVQVVYIRTPSDSGDTYQPIKVGDLPTVQGITTTATSSITACGVDVELLKQQIHTMQQQVENGKILVAPVIPMSQPSHRIRHGLIGGGAAAVGAGIGGSVAGPLGIVAGAATGFLIGVLVHD